MLARLFMLLVGLSIILPLLAVWRLSLGPVPLNFLTDDVARALSSEDGNIVVTVGSTALRWGGWGEPIDVWASDIVVSTRDGREVASIPNASLKFSNGALLRGLLAPTQITLFRPVLTVERSEEGRFSLGLGEQPGAPVTEQSGLISQLLAPPDPAHAAGYLESLRIAGAVVILRDLKAGRTYIAPDTTVRLSRDQDAIRGRVQTRLAMGVVEPLLNAVIIYQRQGSQLSVNVEFDDVELGTLAELIPELEPLAFLDTNFQGRAKVWFTDSVAAGATLDLASGAGQVTLGDWHDRPVRFESLSLSLALQPQVRDLELSRFAVDFGGPKLEVSGRITGGDERGTARIAGTLSDLPLDRLPELWPTALVPNARKWIVEHVPAGQMTQATVDADLSWDGNEPKDLKIERVDGSLGYKDLAVDFRPPLPPAVGVSGLATFDAESMTFRIDRGMVADIAVSEGTVRLSRLHGDRPLARIELVAVTRIPSALQILAGEPINALDKVDLDPESLGGDASARILFEFPMLRGLTFAQVAYEVAARLVRVTDPSIVPGIAISDGDLTLRFRDGRLTYDGTARLNGIPAEISAENDFADDAPYKSRLKVSGSFPAEFWRSQGLDLGTALSGTFPATIERIEGNGGGSTMTVSADLTPARLDVAALGWSKPAGERGRVEARLGMSGGKVTRVESLSVSAPGLAVEGSLSLAGGGPGTVDLRRVRLGETSVSGRADLTGPVPRISLQGATLDLRPLLRSRGSGGATPAFALDGSFGRVIVSDGLALSDVRIDVTRGPGGWQGGSATGRIGAATVAAQLQASATGAVVTVTSADAGALIEALFDEGRIVGGQLSLAVSLPEGGAPIAGRAQVTDFRVVQAPILAKILSVASLVGALDLLAGEGIRFTGAEARFAYADGVLSLADARASGPAIGLSIEGTVDTTRRLLGLDGLLTPLYAVNRALSGIPLIGTLLSGGDEEDGVFAASFTVSGPIASPEVSVNPLSIVTPGLLRPLFELFENGGQTATRPRPLEPIDR